MIKKITLKNQFDNERIRLQTTIEKSISAFELITGCRVTEAQINIEILKRGGVINNTVLTGINIITTMDRDHSESLNEQICQEADKEWRERETLGTHDQYG